MNEEGKRFNKGKLKYHLIHPIAQEGLVKVLTKGSEKYDERNWEKGMSWTSVIASLKRHLAAIERGEDFDLETGLKHADHVQCNAHFLSAYYKIAPQYDDRDHSYLKNKRIGLDIDDVLADFVGAWSRHFNVPIPKSWTFDRNIKQKFEELKDNKEFWLSIPVKTKPEDIPFEPSCYITSRAISKEWTEEWITKMGFPEVPVYSLPPNTSKVELAKQANIDIFVDDKFENFVELNKAGILTYLFDAAHNQRYNVGFKRIYSLQDLIS